MQFEIEFFGQIFSEISESYIKKGTWYMYRMQVITFRHLCFKALTFPHLQAQERTRAITEPVVRNLFPY